MSSVMSAFAQPVTKNFKVDAAGVKMFSGATPSDAMTGVLSALTPANYVKLGSNQFLYDTVEHLLGETTDVTTDGSTTLTQYETLKDMGKQIHFGLQGDDSVLVVFRLVQRASTDVSAAVVGYVCVQNSAQNSAHFVNVSRV